MTDSIVINVLGVQSEAIYAPLCGSICQSAAGQGGGARRDVRGILIWTSGSLGPVTQTAGYSLPSLPDAKTRVVISHHWFSLSQTVLSFPASHTRVQI